jgi:hypothetical protein
MNVLMRYLIFGSFILLSFVLVACSTDQKQYEHSSPNLDLKTYFNGSVTAWGILKNYSDKVTRRFCVEIIGAWQNNEGVLAETFYFDDGEISYRNWQLTKLSNGRYIGTAEDVVGQASGQGVGFSFQWQYQLKIMVDDSEYVLTLDDWLYQLDEYRVFNQTELKKFGIAVAHLTIFFDKAKPLRQCVKPEALTLS